MPATSVEFRGAGLLACAKAWLALLRPFRQIVRYDNIPMNTISRRRRLFASAPRIEVHWEPIWSPGGPNWRNTGQHCDSAPRPFNNRVSDISLRFRSFLTILTPML